MKEKNTPLSVAEASKILAISPQRVRELCRSGEISAEQFGRTWVVNKEAVNGYGMRSGRILAEDHVAYNWEGTRNKPVALSFFSGAMGLDLGLEAAGFDVRLACETEKFCRQTIIMNRPSTALLGDILEYDAESVRTAALLSANEEIDLVAGGPPCQAFSTAGKRQGFNDKRGNVFLHYVDLAIALNPKFIVIENVRGLLSCPISHRPHDLRGVGTAHLSGAEAPGGALRLILRKLENSGYSYSFNLYNAANFGTPQSRERVVIVCSREGMKIPYLEPTHSPSGEFGLPMWKTFREAVQGVIGKTSLSFPEKRLRYYRLLGPGENWKNLPVELQREALGKSYFSGGGKTGFFRRLAWDAPSPTLVTHPAMPATDLAHPIENRPLSIEEYKKIQEFPDSWKLAGSLVQQYKQVGNAVPMSLGLAIGTLVRKLIAKEKVKDFPGFKYSRYKDTDHISWLASSPEELPLNPIVKLKGAKLAASA